MKKLSLATTALLAVFTQPAFAYFVGGVDTDVLYTAKADENDGNATGFRTGVSVAYGMEQIYISGRLATGSDNFSASNSDQSETDFELTSGYRITPALSTFLAFRFRSQDYLSGQGAENDATETHNHFGAGVALGYPVNRNFLIRGEAKAFYLISQYETDTIFNTANGFSGGTNVGVIYSWKNGINAGVSAKLQAMNIGYNTGGSYTDLQAGINLSVTRAF